MTAWQHITANWQSTAQSVLTAIIGLSAVAPQIAFLSAKQGALLVSAGVVAKVILGAFQKDAGTVPVKTSEGIENAPSHETPDDPTKTVAK